MTRYTFLLVVGLAGFGGIAVDRYLLGHNRYWLLPMGIEIVGLASLWRGAELEDRDVGIDRDLQTLGALSAVGAMNEKIQEIVAEEGEELPPELLRVLTDLDVVVRAALDSQQGAVANLLARREPIYRFADRLRASTREMWDRALNRDRPEPPPKTRRPGPPGEPMSSGFTTWTSRVPDEVERDE